MKFIPKPFDCQKCKRCYRHRIEEIATVAFIFGILGCEVALALVNWASKLR